jgi:hypothetical protein
MWFWILLIVLIVVMLGSAPAWPHSRAWGYGPSGGAGVLVAILLLLLFFGMFDVPGCTVDMDTPAGPGSTIENDLD